MNECATSGGHSAAAAAGHSPPPLAWLLYLPPALLPMHAHTHTFETRSASWSGSPAVGCPPLSSAARCAASTGSSSSTDGRSRRLRQNSSPGPTAGWPRHLCERRPVAGSAGQVRRIHTALRVQSNTRLQQMLPARCSPERARVTERSCCCAARSPVSNVCPPHSSDKPPPNASPTSRTSPSRPNNPTLKKTHGFPVSMLKSKGTIFNHSQENSGPSHSRAAVDRSRAVSHDGVVDESDRAKPLVGILSTNVIHVLVYSTVQLCFVIFESSGIPTIYCYASHTRRTAHR